MPHAIMTNSARFFEVTMSPPTRLFRFINANQNKTEITASTVVRRLAAHLADTASLQRQGRRC
jgi:hypothetical protein